MFIKVEMQWIIADLYKKRFENQGAINDHPKWDPNVRPDIKYEKYNQTPLVDTGELKASLINPSNWNIDVDFENEKIEVTFPDKENFTDPKYDSLEDSSGGEYYGGRTGKKIVYDWKPVREFKTISAADEAWIAEQLEIKIQEKYGI